MNTHLSSLYVGTWFGLARVPEALYPGAEIVGVNGVVGVAGTITGAVDLLDTTEDIGNTDDWAGDDEVGEEVDTTNILKSCKHRVPKCISTLNISTRGENPLYRSGFVIRIILCIQIFPAPLLHLYNFSKNYEMMSFL